MASSTPSAGNLLELLEVRAQGLVDGARATKAQPPEVRAGLVEIHRQFSAQLGRVANDDAELEALERALNTFVDRRLREYIAWLRPPTAASRLFENALRTTQRYAATKGGVATVRCHVCGAAREGEAVTVCQYCETPLEHTR